LQLFCASARKANVMRMFLDTVDHPRSQRRRRELDPLVDRPGAGGSLIREFVDSSRLTGTDLGASVTAAGDLNGDGVSPLGDCDDTDGADTIAVDTDAPPPGSFFACLVRVETACGGTIEEDRTAANGP
jgi:hypothetical protein